MRHKKSALALVATLGTIAGLSISLSTPAGACSESQCLGTSVQANMARQAWQTNQDNMNAAHQAALDQQNAMATSGPPSPQPHAVFATHPDADDIWVAAMYPDVGAARYRAMLQCRDAMGDGCKWTWQAGRGHYGAARAPDGRVIEALGNSKGEVRKQLDEWCKVYELGCVQLGIFNARSEFRKYPRTGDNVRAPANLANVRKLYAAAAWLDADSFDGRTWIATGYATAKQAQDVALNACNLRANNNKPCSIAVTTGNGVMVSFSLGNGLQRVLVDQSEARAREAVAKLCAREKFSCKVHHVYDARTSGVFENKL
jgi:hypothetical protein